MAGSMLICPPCAAGRCSDCRERVNAGRVTKACTCRHGRTRSPQLARPSDPRLAGGAMVHTGPGEGEALLDTTRAVLLSESNVCRVDQPSGGPPVIAMLLTGRINRTSDLANVLYLLNGDGAAALVTELVALAARMGPEFEAEFRAALDERIQVAELWPSVAPAGGADR